MFMRNRTNPTNRNASEKKEGAELPDVDLWVHESEHDKKNEIDHNPQIRNFSCFKINIGDKQKLNRDKNENQ